MNRMERGGRRVPQLTRDRSEPSFLHILRVTDETDDERGIGYTDTSSSHDHGAGGSGRMEVWIETMTTTTTSHNADVLSGGRDAGNKGRRVLPFCPTNNLCA